MKQEITIESGLWRIYWLFATVYTFIIWGFWWGILSLFLPIFPIIDLIKHLFL